jgi:hypothetical protein
MPMTPRLLICGFLLLGCSGDPMHPPSSTPEPEDTGGSTGTSTGGKAATGGSTGTSTGGITGTGGTVSGTGGTTTQSLDAGTSTEPDGGAATDAASGPPPVAGEAPYGCSGCRRLFDGKTLDGWVTVEGAWVVKDGALASTGKANDIFTKEDIGDARIFFQVRQIKGDHKPCTTLFGNRPAGTSGSRGLSGAQFQPPNGAFWNYGVGGTFKRLVNPNFDVSKWHQCEIIIKEAGSFRAACCPYSETAACKGVEVLQWTGKGKKFPFDIMMHNGGLMDEYREIWIETSPKEDGFLSQK